MLSDRDRAVVIEMCRTGMNLDVLKRSFPQFPGEDIEKLYEETLQRAENKANEEINISCNCS